MFWVKVKKFCAEALRNENIFDITKQIIVYNNLIIMYI